MKKIPMILLAMFTLSGCDRQEMIYSFNHVEEASVDNEVENTESVDNIQAETEQAVDITTEEPEISDVYSGPTVTLAMVDNRNVCRLHLLFHISKKTGKIIRAILCLTAFFHRSVKQNIPNHGKCHGRT